MFEFMEWNTGIFGKLCVCIDNKSFEGKKEHAVNWLNSLNDVIPVVGLSKFFLNTDDHVWPVCHVKGPVCRI